MNDNDKNIEYELYVIHQQISIVNDALMQLIKRVEGLDKLNFTINNLTEDINKLAENIQVIEQNQRQKADDRY